MQVQGTVAEPVKDSVGQYVALLCAYYNASDHAVGKQLDNKSNFPYINIVLWLQT